MNLHTGDITTDLRQRGVVLILALIVLVAMTLAAIALVRSVDATTQVAGNLAFRQSGTQFGDTGIEQARNWLRSSGADFSQPIAGSGYFATWNGGATGNFDPATFDWDTNASPAVNSAKGENKVRYVIHRLCENNGDPTVATTNCVNGPATETQDGDSQGGLSYGDAKCPNPPNCKISGNPIYRITSQVTGPRNTVSYIQAFIY